MDELIELTKRHKIQMDEEDILVSVYTNSSGFLWELMMVSTGTNLGYSGFVGDCEMSGTFTSYNKALKDALDLVAMCDLETYKRSLEKDGFHWVNYSEWIRKNYYVN